MKNLWQRSLSIICLLFLFTLHGYTEFTSYSLTRRSNCSRASRKITAVRKLIREADSNRHFVRSGCKNKKLSRRKRRKFAKYSSSDWEKYFAKYLKRKNASNEWGADYQRYVFQKYVFYEFEGFREFLKSFNHYEERLIEAYNRVVVSKDLQHQLAYHFIDDPEHKNLLSIIFHEAKQIREQKKDDDRKRKESEKTDETKQELERLIKRILEEYRVEVTADSVHEAYLCYDFVHELALLDRLDVVQNSPKKTNAMSLRGYILDVRDLDKEFLQERGYDEAFLRCSPEGDDLQYLAQQEFILHINQNQQFRKQFNKNEFIMPLIDRHETCIKMGLACNQVGEIEKTFCFSDLCWRIAQNIVSFTEGVSNVIDVAGECISALSDVEFKIETTINNAVIEFLEDLKEQPEAHLANLVKGSWGGVVSTAKTTAEIAMDPLQIIKSRLMYYGGAILIGAQLCSMSVDLCIEAIGNPEKAKEKVQVWNSEACEYIDGIGEYVHDMDKAALTYAASKFVVEGYLTGKVTKWAGKVAKSARAKATQKLKNGVRRFKNKLTPVSQAVTPEGVKVPIKDQGLNGGGVGSSVEKSFPKSTKGKGRCYEIYHLGASESIIKRLSKRFSGIFEVKGPKSLERLGVEKINQKFKIDRQFLKHIFSLECKIFKNSSNYLKKKIYGLHHYDTALSFMNKDYIKFIPGTLVRDPGGSSAFKVSLMFDGIIKKTHSFFPVEWTPDQIVYKIIEASSNVISVERSGRQVIEGITKCGLKITMIIEKGQLVTAYPSL